MDRHRTLAAGLFGAAAIAITATMADTAATAPSPFNREPLQLATINAIKIAVATASNATTSRRLILTTHQG